MDHGPARRDPPPGTGPVPKAPFTCGRIAARPQIIAQSVNRQVAGGGVDGAGGLRSGAGLRLVLNMSALPWSRDEPATEPSKIRLKSCSMVNARTTVTRSTPPAIFPPRMTDLTRDPS